MKKISLNIAILATVIAAIFSSCDKDVESTAIVLDLNDSAKITLYIYADLDKTEAGLETVPEGTEVYIKIDYADYRPGVAGSFNQTATVGASGMLTIDVPADDDGVTVEITPLPFEADQTQSFGTYEETVSKIYSASPVIVNVSAGEYKLQQITYNTPENFSGFVAMTMIEGYITADLSDTAAVDEDVMKVIQLTFHTPEWSETVSTASDGSFSVIVPAGEDIYVDALFQAQVYIDPDKYLYEFELKNSFVGNYSAVQDDIEISFGTGIEVE